ncbi:MAG: NAD-dependent epimerase/dehydratase family protein [Ktedonobacterales bacterium]|nr:NAD-dependent epimerase/dehydratase family protein [Ktedonobacterales bacterium]
MRIVVIGGTRFMGPEVVRRLRADGHDVTVFHRGETLGDLPPEVRHITGDRHRLADAASAFRRVAPEVVLDMIPFTEEDARGLMAAFTGLARRVVAISSQDVYRAFGRVNRFEPGPPDPRVLTEDAPLRERLYPHRGETPRAEGDPLRWRDDYDKILVERVVMGEADLPGTILRLPAVYGPLDYQHRTFEYLRRMDDNRPAILLDAGLARWRWSRGYVEDVAHAITLAVTREQATGRVYNVAEPSALSMTEWIRAIGQAAGWHGEIVVARNDHLPTHLIADIETEQPIITASARIRQELGYVELVPREEAFARTVAWERANPPADSDPAAFDYAAEDAALARLRRGDAV